MAYCRECGTLLIDGSKFCSACGTKIVEESETSTTPENHEENDNFAQREFDPSGVQYYDPYEEDVVKKGKPPICGRIGLSLFLGVIILCFVLVIKGGGDIVSAFVASVALIPVIILLALGSLALAIVSMVRKERKACADVIIGGLFLGLIIYVYKVVMS